MKNYKSLSVYKDRDVYIFGASGGGEIVKDFWNVMMCRFAHSWILIKRSGVLPFLGMR